MRSKLIHAAAGQKIYAVILETGDEAMACLNAFAVEHGISAASFKAIGAFRSAELSYFDWETKGYIPIPVQEQVEVASLTGDIAVEPGEKPAVHMHAVLGKRDGSTVAGHLSRGDVRPTLEIVLSETPTHLAKRRDTETGLMLISLDD
ncbi:PPC domain-containing DNA-binding protein [Bosea sp. 2KB_26]|uniref:PPC domain-containing DNA-binding protein n=1 Tax=Bosea sp. 2KB_26 TaxID=3237475 RepID=UPI003F8ED7A6